jgi:hypothetical protein
VEWSKAGPERDDERGIVPAMAAEEPGQAQPRSHRLTHTSHTLTHTHSEREQVCHGE